MNNIITPAEVVRLAFTDGEYVSPEVVGEADIEAAIRRRIEPVAGRAMCEAMRGGAYPDFVRDYAAAAIALCVRVMVQPRLNVATGQTGLAVPAGTYRKAADADARAELARALRIRAREAVRRMSDYLEANADTMAEYDPNENILKRCNCDGGFVQIR